MRPREAPLNRTTGVPPLGAQVRARCDVIETAASSSFTSRAPSAAAVALPGARTPSPSRPPPHRPVRLPAAHAADTTSRAAAATLTHLGSTTTLPGGPRSARAPSRRHGTSPAPGDRRTPVHVLPGRFPAYLPDFVNSLCISGEAQRVSIALSCRAWSSVRRSGWRVSQPVASRTDGALRGGSRGKASRSACVGEDVEPAEAFQLGAGAVEVLRQ